jgi:hypothetical protein
MFRTTNDKILETASLPLVANEGENGWYSIGVRPNGTIFGPATSFSPAMQNAIFQYNINVQPIPFGVKFIIPF